MKNWLLHIFYWEMIVLLIASCSQDESIPMPDSNKMQVVFTLALDDPSFRSRAAWNENQGEADAAIGDESDNKIALNQLQVVLYEEDGSFMGKVNNLQYYQTEQINVYRFVGNLSMNAQRELKGKIMVFANMGEGNTISGNTDLSELSFPHDNDCIPMWGVSSIHVTVTPGKQTILDKPIYLLRAMAKVEVTLDERLIADGCNLDKVVLENYNTLGYCLPSGYTNASYTELLDTENVLHVYSSLKEGQRAFWKNETTSSYIIYVPEYLNETGEKTSYMEVTIKDKAYRLDFKYYGTGSSFNLIRNHYYRFNILSIAPDDIDGNLYYKVEDWQEEKIEIGFN